MKKWFGILALVLVLAFVVPACSSSTPTATTTTSPSATSTVPSTTVQPTTTTAVPTTTTAKPTTTTAWPGVIAREAITVAKKNREISDTQFHQLVVNTVAAVSG